MKLKVLKDDDKRTTLYYAKQTDEWQCNICGNMIPAGEENSTIKAHLQNCAKNYLIAQFHTKRARR